MGGKYDLSRMLRLISEEKSAKSGQSRALTQEEIMRLIAQKKKQTQVPKEESGRL